MAATLRNSQADHRLDTLQRYGTSVRKPTWCVGICLGNALVASASQPLDWGLTLDQAYAQVLPQCLRKVGIV